MNLIADTFFLKDDHYQNIFFLRGFIDHSSLSLLVSFSIFILLHILLEKPDNKKILNRKTIYTLIFILILFLLNSYGRTGFFTLIILSPVFLLVKSPKNIKYLVFFSLLFISISISISSPFKNRIKSTFVFQKDIRTDHEKIKEDAQYMADSLGENTNYWEQKINNDLAWKHEVIKKNKKSSLERRYEIWEKYKIQILEKPFIGTGAGGVHKIITTSNITRRPHNSYILIIFEFGIIGLILFLNIFYVQLKSFFLEKNKKETTLKLIFPLLFLICMIINDYIIIYNTVCFFSLFSFLLYSKESSNLN